jgi:phosphatidylserine decarboxylase
MKIHREGHRIIFTCSAVLLLITSLWVVFFGFNPVFWIVAPPLWCLWLFVGYFFRVPSREAISAPNTVMAAADGQIVIVEEVYEPEYLKAQCLQVSIFMSVFNVHANYFPVNGVVEYCRYHPGKYIVAWHPKSSEKNERTTVVVNHNGTSILFRQIAGLIARRIVCYAKEGMPVEQNDEVGFIKFGSRVDIFLPLNATIKVKKGDKVKAKETVIACL